MVPVSVSEVPEIFLDLVIYYMPSLGFYKNLNKKIKREDLILAHFLKIYTFS